jgi:hypothetical protein
MAYELNISDPSRRTGLTVVAKLYGAGTLASTVTLSNLPTGSPNYTNASNLSSGLAAGLYEVTFDAGDATLLGTGLLDWSGTAEVVQPSGGGTGSVLTTTDLSDIAAYLIGDAAFLTAIGNASGGSTAGTGPYATTVTIEANSVPLVGFKVYASQSGQPDAVQFTNSSGVATFNLYAGSATFTPDNSTGYSGSPVTETISGAGSAGVVGVSKVASNPTPGSIESSQAGTDTIS